MLSNSTSLWQSAVLGGLSAEAKAVLANLPNTSGADAAAVANFVDDCVADGNWALLDGHYLAIHALSNATDARTNVFTGTAGTEGGGGASHSPGVGYVFTGGTTGYVDTGFQANAPSQNETLGAYVVSLDADPTFDTVFGASDGTNVSRVNVNGPKYDSVAGTAQLFFNSQSLTNSSNNVGTNWRKQFLIASGRDNGTENIGYYDGVLVERETDSGGTNVSGENFYVGAENVLGVTTSPILAKIGLTFYGKQVGFDHAAFEKAVYRLMAALGAADRFSTPLIIGDSNTEGTAGSSNTSWVDQITEFTPANSIDQYRGGQWLAYDPDGAVDTARKGAITDIDTWLSGFTGDSVIISGGTNDISNGNPYDIPDAGILKHALAQIVTKCKDVSTVRDIIVMNVIPNANNGSTNNAVLAAYNSWLPGFCQREGIHLYDWNAAVRDEAGTAIDEAYESDQPADVVHLNAAGMTKTAADMDVAIANVKKAKVITPKRVQTQVGIGWDAAASGSYDGAATATDVYTGDRIDQTRTTAVKQFVPMDSHMPNSGKHYVELEIKEIGGSGRIGWIGELYSTTFNTFRGGDLGATFPNFNYPCVELVDQKGISANIEFANDTQQDDGAHVGARVMLAWDGDNSKFHIGIQGRWLNSDPTDPNTGIAPSTTDGTGYTIAVQTGDGTNIHNLDVTAVSEVPEENIPEGYTLWDGTV